MKNTAGILAVLTLFICGMASTTTAEEPKFTVSTKEQRDKRMEWWNEAKYGMFIHWGVYSTAGGYWNDKPVDGWGEWLMCKGKLQVPEYETLLKQFNPVKFDAKQWVKIAKNAGMKYIVITAKHHDGFCLWDSKLTDYDVMSTPFKRDIMKELSEAARSEGIKIGWYYSVMDWHHPDYLPRGPGSERPWDTRSTTGADHNRYIDYMKGQLRELLTNYGPIGVLWFDVAYENRLQYSRANEELQMIRSIQPDVIVNGRLLATDTDYEAVESHVPASTKNDTEWETCRTSNNSWGYRKDDNDWKTKEYLVREMVDVVNKGGNYLLNVGPTGEGIIPDGCVQKLEEVGKWMAINGESIYGAKASPFKNLDWGRCTRKDDKLYLHVFDWPKNGKLEVPCLKNNILKAYILGDSTRAKLKNRRTEDGIVIDVPPTPLDPVDTVVVLKIKGNPDLAEKNVLPDQNGKVDLKVIDSGIEGTARLEDAWMDGKGPVLYIGNWTNTSDFVRWNIRFAKPGTYAVQLTYACETNSPGAEYTINLGDQTLKGTVASSGGREKSKTEKPGTLKVLNAGKTLLTVKALSKPGQKVMNLVGITLTPGD